MEENTLQSKMNGTKRLDYIDIAKGIGIILIVLGHSISGETLFCKWIYLFHVPLFFFLSGFTYNEKKYLNFIPFLNKRVRQLLVPSFYFTIITLIVAKIFVPEFYSFQSLFLGLPHAMWFLPILFVVEVIYWSIGKLPDCKIIYIVIISFFFGIILFRYAIHFPYRMDTVFYGLAYYGIGNFARRKIYSITHSLHINKRVIRGGKFAALAIPLLCVTVTGKTIQFWNNELPRPEFLYILISLVGIYGIILFSNNLPNQIKGIFIYIGKNTLTILCVHMLYISLLRHYLGYDIKDLTFVSFELSLLCVLLYVTIIFINKNCSFLIGKNAK